MNIDHMLCVEIVRMESLLQRTVDAQRWTDAQELTDTREQLLMQHMKRVREDTDAVSTTLRPRHSVRQEGLRGSAAVADPEQD